MRESTNRWVATLADGSELASFCHPSGSPPDAMLVTEKNGFVRVVEWRREGEPKRGELRRMKYRLRAEVPLDVALLLVALSKADVNVADCEQRQLLGYPDVDFVFNCNASIEKIREVMRTIEDSHVMLETVAPFDEYTGERNRDIR